MRDRRTARGFTLLEVMVSLAILAVSLVAVLNLHSGAVTMHNHAKHLTLATLLARSKMVDVEEHIYTEELSEFDDRLEGDFEEEGYPGFTWQAEIVKPELALDASQLAGLIGQAMGLDPESMESGEGGLLGSLGPGVEGVVGGQVENLTKMIEEGVREVRLTVHWKDITGDSAFQVVTHVVKLPGQGAPGGAADIQAQQASDALKKAQQGLGNLPNIPGARSPNVMVPSIQNVQNRIRKVGP